MEAIEKASAPICWCGENDLTTYSPQYLLCATCGTLVSRIGFLADKTLSRDELLALYGKDYYVDFQVLERGNPDLLRRARADLPERCLYWLRTLLLYLLPPGRILEIGCSHGGFVAMLRSIGFDAMGLELSPWVVEFARHTFGIPVLQGLLEEQSLAEQSFHAVVLNDVVEHLVDPLATLRCCARLLCPEGILVVQMPSFPEGSSYDELRDRKDLFLKLMTGEWANQHHLHLFSPRATQRLFQRLHFTSMDIVPALFPYDQYVIASRQDLVRHAQESQDAALMATPGGRQMLALLDLDAHHQVCEQDRAERLKVIHCLDQEIQQLRATQRQPPSPLLPMLLRRFLPGRVFRSLKRLVRAS
jgi:2-polyprenyl-3-methyl-5-hydroxy-6-metoxy-1,4-benzoquinol methylase